MGLDGLSVSNLGLFKGVTSAEVIQEAVKMAQTQAETTIKKIDESGGTKLTPDKENENEDEATNYEGRENSSGQKESEETLENKLQTGKIKKYKVHFNQITDMVELMDNSTGMIIESINPNDLIALISKSKNPSGILVDKEI